MGKHANCRDPGFSIPYVGFVAYKHVSLLLLVTQTVGGILVLRISRTIGAGKIKYLNTTAVCMSEIIKLIVSFLLLLSENYGSIRTTVEQINSNILHKPSDTLKVGIPSLLYCVQNNLLFVALSNMSPATYQVTYQLKILTTAVLSVIILRKILSFDKWTCLVLLTLGVGLIQIPATPSSAPQRTHDGNLLLGTTAVLLACVTSGLAGVYLEKLLKDSNIWIRNIQLAFLGCFISLIGVFYNDGTAVIRDGFFQGYNSATWSAILTQSAGGLIVAFVLKFADNILKCFGNSVAIVMSCFISYYYLGDYQPTVYFIIGALLVVIATYAYGTGLVLLSAWIPKQKRDAELIQLHDRAV